MSDSPKFSVVIPLYNKRAYIRRAVDSVLKQTLTDFELIVVDDGSTDESIETLADISDRRLRIIRQQNQGEGPARNAGICLTRSTWIALLDADDSWTECHLCEMAKIVNKYPDAGLISTSCIEATGSTVPHLPTAEALSSIRKVDYFAEASRKIGFINSSSSAVQRHVFEELGGFINVKAGADLEYWARVALAYPVAVSNRVTCAYFRDTGGVMHQIAARPIAQQPQTIQSLSEISPSVAMLCDRAEANTFLWKNASIRAYVNGRLGSCIKSAIYHGDTSSARMFLSFILPPLTLRQRCYSLVTYIPKDVVLGMVSIYRYFR